MRQVLCHGCYDVIHPGHLEHFKKAKALGDRLVVSVTSDRWVLKGPGRPIFPQAQRMAMISELRCVDGVTLTDAETAVELINMLKPEIFCKGPDYHRYDRTSNLQKEKAAVESYGGRLVIVDNDIVYS